MRTRAGLVTLPLFALLSVGGGCQIIAGLGDPKIIATSTGDSGTGGASNTTGTGGQTAPSFVFAITDASVNVPYGGVNYVNVKIVPMGGFSDSVTVTVQGAPTGLVTMPLMIQAGSTTGQFQVSAGATLTLGTMFTLTLVATSGTITQTAMVPAVVTGKPGTFDMSFGGSGLVAGPQGAGNSGGANLHDVEEVAQGNIVAAGNKYTSQGTSVAIGLRLLPSGEPDTSFNSTGVISNSICSCSSYYDVATSVAREIDGTLLFVGYGNPTTSSTTDVLLFRYQDDGAVANVMGDNGVEDISLGGSEVVNVAALVPSSTEVLAAGARNSQLFVTRIPESLAGGTPDNSFAAPNGWIAPVVGAMNSSANAFTFDAMGNIIVTGWVTNSSMDSDVVMLRLTPDGVLDQSFMGGGVVTLARPGNQNGLAVLVQPDGNILVAAGTDEGNSYQLLLQRFLSSGAPDTSFGTQGAVLAPLGGSTPVLPGGPSAWMVLMLDGRIVVAGNPNANGSMDSQPVFARFLPNGSPDPTFGSGGNLMVYVGDFGVLGAMTLASDGKLLIGGSNGSGPSSTFIARLWN